MYRQWSIRQLLLALGLTITLPLLFALAITEYNDYRADLNKAGESALNIAQLAAANTNKDLAGTKEKLEGLSHRPLIQAATPQR